MADPSDISAPFELEPAFSTVALTRLFWLFAFAVATHLLILTQGFANMHYDDKA